MKTHLVRFCGIHAITLAAVVFAVGARAGHEEGAPHALPLPQPMFSDALLISASTTPPTQLQCFSVHRRCFTPQTVQTSYNLGPLYAAGNQGQGQTIAIIDSYGSDTIAHDLSVYNTAFGLPHMCG